MQEVRLIDNYTDCLLIGHNEMDFEQYEKMVEAFGIDSEVYRDTALDFVYYGNKPYTIAGMYNYLAEDKRGSLQTIEPMGIGNILSPAIVYLGSYLNKRGFTFDFINSFQDQKELLAEKLMKGNIRSIGITTTFYLTAAPIIEIISFIRKYNESIKIIVGGPFILSRYRTLEGYALKGFWRVMHADFYIINSQGEQALTEILCSLKQNSSDYTAVKNIAYRSGNQYVVNEIIPEKNILQENMVDWELFSGAIKSTASVRCSISCPYKCAFCNIPEREGAYQTIDVSALESELNQLQRLNIVKRINFVDDTFNIPTDRFKNILRMMIKNRYPFKWIGYFRSQFADREMLELMKESGCLGVFLGVESGNPEVLTNMNKFSDVDKYYRVIEMLREYDIVSYVSMIIGFPGETLHTAEDTISFIKQSKPDFYNVNALYLDQHTPIWRVKDKYGVTGQDYQWSHQTMDSKTACDIVDRMLLEIDDSIYVPEYNFEFPGIFNLMDRGMSLEQSKEFISLFSQGVKEKLAERQKKNCSETLINKMRDLV